MKKIIPFQKELSFDTKIYEISSISLEHTLKLKEENQISGEFIISGTYKLTEASINVDPFEYILPFSISIDKKYDTKNIDVDINDFYYELSANQILSVNIEVVIDGLEEKEEIFVTKEKTVIPNEPEDIREEVDTKELATEENPEPVVKTEPQSEEIPRDETAKSIFENLDENERYSVYKIHIVTENDTIESILQKYQITKEELEAYNDLNDMQIGSKLIIQANENQ